jgi:4-hydroxyphenylpyruvate dioxygenase
MELNIPAVHGVGNTRIYFVDRWREFSIYDVDFVPIPTVDPNPAPIEGMHFFGVVQYIGVGRSDDWIEFYEELFGAQCIPDDERYGIMPAGHLLRFPSTDAANAFMLQIVEPPPDALEYASEGYARVGLGVGDVVKAAQALRERGIAFIESAGAHTEPRGAITKTYLGSVAFELVHDTR